MSSQFTPSDWGSLEFEGRRCSKRRQAGEFEVIQMGNTRYRKAADYLTYCVENKSREYDYTVSKNISKMAKCMSAQMTPQVFYLSDSILMIGFYATLS